MEQWRICVKDKYPTYIPWDTFEQIQLRLQDNYAEYDRKQSRGIPRPGIALLHGLVYCGECGHKLLVQYKGSPCYLCNYLRQQYGVPVCQRIPTAPIDAYVVEAFFQALAPIELDVYARAVATQVETAERVGRAHQQHVDRLRYETALAQRQFQRVDPDNRLVAAELEKRWEVALSTLKQTEEAEALRPHSSLTLAALPPNLQAAFAAIGPKLPLIWPQLSRATQKALLRCLIDKVVIHRIARDCVQVRMVWKGGETSTRSIPIPVGSLADLSTAEAMTNLILELSTQGQSDDAIAQQLTTRGYRSPMQLTVLPSTVKTIRLKHRILQKHSQSHPRHIPGFLTVPQIATALEVSTYWVYDRISKGAIGVVKDVNTDLYLFPDDPATLAASRDFKTGKLHHLRFS
jgi:hypothetical protein